MLKTKASRKNAAAYQVSLSAVKKIQKEKSGIDRIREIIPAKTANLEFLFQIRNARIIKKTISCGFISYANSIFHLNT